MVDARPGRRLDSLASLLAESLNPLARPAVYRLAPEERCPAHEKWTSETLAAKGDDIEVGVHRGRLGAFFDFSQSPLDLASSAVTHRTTLGALVRRIVGARRSEVVSANWFELLSGTDTHLVLENGPVERWRGLWSECADMVEAHVPIDALRRVGFWVSGRGLSSQMHWDVNGHHNFNYQITGRKSVVMFAPEDGRFLYPMPGRLWHLSRIDPRPGRFSPVQHPLVARARPITFELEPGDVLLIPAGWYHHFYHVGEFNINITAWFHSSRSGRVWPWSSLLVPYPVEAWLFVAKLLVAVVIVVARLARDKLSWGVRGDTTMAGRKMSS